MLSDDSDGEDIQQLTINEHYAKAFEYRKEREELAKLKEKYGSDVDDNDEEEEDSEDLESEDEDGEELTPALDAAILRTLARIKRKDPSIYEDGKDVFQEEIKKTGEAKIFRHSSEDKSKPITIRQHVLASALNPSSRSPSPEPITHVKEQEALRNETIAAFHTSAPDAEDDDEFLVPREKTKDELEREEEEYKEFLEREVGEDLKGLITVEEGDFLHDAGDEAESSHQEKKQAKRNKRDKKAKKSEKSKQEKDQEFLMNYILNRGWIDKSSKRLPTYKEITSSRKGKEKALEDDSEEETFNAQSEPSEDEIDEDEFDEVAERFETSYNFRFEEPGADQIARYPRNIESLVRREDSTRKEAREKRKARKEEELLKKKEEVKRLKALKMKEVRTKLEQIGREGGKNLEDTKALEALDLDGDWDPDAHDKQMADIYGQDDDGPIDDEKPQWDDDIDITDIVPNAEESEDEGAGKKKKKKKKKQKGGDSEDEGGVDVNEMDADVKMVVDEEEWDGTEEMRKRKLDAYMDEVYGLEFNDLVGGMPTRFRYTKVQPQAFALTPAEILLATDAELNQYMGIKKYAPYRKDGSNWDKNRAARLRELKTKIGERRKAFGGGDGGDRDVFADASAGGHDKPAKKRKGKKERLRAKALAGGQDDDGQDDDEVNEEPTSGKEETRSKRDRTEETTGESIANEGNSQKHPKKRKRRHKKSGQEETMVS